MPPSNLPDPNKIPDMSLGERADVPAPLPTPDVASSFQPKSEPSLPAPQPTPDVESSIQPKSEPLLPAPVPVPVPDAAPMRWRVGDDVLAPWEPMFLYVGTIREIRIDDARGDQALINFDDGGEGWVFLYSLSLLDIKVGEDVQCRRRNGIMHFSPAEIVDVSDGEVKVRFDDGSTEWTRYATLRVPCIENGPGATPTRFADFQGPNNGGAAASPGFPRWVIWVGLMILLSFVRIACQTVRH